MIFGEQPLPNTVTEIARGLQNQVTVLSPVNSVEYKGSWHLRIGHLVGYGAGYYSYLYAKMFASSIWQSVFAHNSLSRDAGELIINKMMVHGGAKDPMIMLHEIIGEDPMTERYYLQELGMPR